MSITNWAPFTMSWRKAVAAPLLDLIIFVDKIGRPVLATR